MFLHKSHIWENFAPEIQAKIFSANQITGFFNELYLQNKSVKQPDFLQVDTHSQNLKVDQKICGWEWSKMGVASLVMGLENCTSRMNGWKELIFCMLVQIQEAKITMFEWAWQKMGVVH